ncbi:MAG: glycosyltransferase [Actinomycetota bacterium]|nr:glycosyltransferase [Actinomycetota bacterium]
MDSHAGMDMTLLSLFPAVDDTVHPSAAPWIGRVRRPNVVSAIRDLGWWAVRRPVALLTAIAAVVVGCVRSPQVLVRSLATVPLAASHARYLENNGFDHVHAHFATYPALAAWLCFRLARIPYSFTAHAHDIFVDQSMLARKLAEARFVATVSEYNRAFLKAYGGDSVTPVSVIHPGIDPDAYPYRPRSPGEGPVRGLCVASLQEYKGHVVLLEALTQAGLERLSIDLVGGGQLRDQLQSRCRELGIDARVRFRGVQTEKEVGSMLVESDLFVLPSIIARDGQMEGLPMVLIEALATGLPTVATRLAGIPEIVRDGETGLLVPPGDPDALAGALRAALSGGTPDPAAGRRLVEAEFDLRLCAERMVTLLRNEHVD